MDEDNWYAYWTEMALQSHLVVCFDDDDYLDSGPCQKEFRYAKGSYFKIRKYVDHYISVGRYMDDKDPKEMAEHIANKVP